jgi:3-phosphoinositide dependent protein kinase-1
MADFSTKADSVKTPVDSSVDVDGAEPIQNDKKTVAAMKAAADSNMKSASEVGSLGNRIDPNTLERGHFFFGKTLGEGSYARVVHAKMKAERSPEFAIKIMEKQFIVKEKKVKFVMMEKNILSSISHPFIIKLYYTFKDKDYLYMCMDLAAGGELKGLIHRYQQEHEAKGLLKTGCTEEIARFYSAEIVEACDFLHKHDIIHMDLKPENILITSSGHVKIADFGTALKGIDPSTMTNIFVGTPEYVSPEVLNEDHDISIACDLWAVGCIIYQLLTGLPPFHAETEYLIFQTINNHIEGTSEIEYPPSVPSTAKDIIAAMLIRDPPSRLGAGGEGAENSYAVLKGKEFFTGIPWEHLSTIAPPYIPDESSLPSTDNMVDGALDEWLLEGGDGEAEVVGLDRDSDFMQQTATKSKTPVRGYAFV